MKKIFNKQLLKVLIVCSGAKENFDFKKHQCFIYEQTEAIKRNGIIIDYFFINNRGIWGYLKNYKKFKIKIKAFKPDIVHAFYGFSCLFANLQRTIPVISTFIGSDINNYLALKISKISIHLSKHNIFVSQKLLDVSKTKKKFSILPFGVDFNEIYYIDKSEAKSKLGLDFKKNFALFSSYFENRNKNFALAIKSINLIDNIELLEIKNRERFEVNLLFNACDLLIFTSFSEGSPQVIKEALACGCPVVSVDVGDIREVIGDTAGCYITSYNENEISEKIKLVLKDGKRINGKQRIIDLGLDNHLISKKIVNIYNEVIKKNDYNN
ncbi:MAG: glycosyltransferase family 4 protein [Candidatus Lokiarchaeota archaeon]|nr:glycosyltransferase family 4 protein [Candidatus Lokiarchaeota archaeon]